MNNNRKLVLLPVPRWKQDDHRWPMWQLIDDILLNDFSKKDIHVTTQRSKPNKSSVYDLIFSHHARNNSEKIIDYKQNYLPKLWYFDTDGYSGYSRLAEEPLEYFVPPDVLQDEDAMKDIRTFYEETIYPQTVNTKFVQQEKIESNLPNEFLLIATQIESDTVMKLKEIETEEMVHRAVKVSKRTGIPIVIKTHPRDRNINPIERLIKKYRVTYEGYFFRSYGDIQSLLDLSVATFIINSGVGFETLMRLKPVFSFGKSDYAQATWYNKDIDDIVDLLGRGVDKDLIMLFLYNYWQEIIDLSLSGYREKIYHIIQDKLYGKK